jgi:hypothetical protein
MIIDNFYFIGITVPKLETDAPACVHRHGPLGLAAALQLVKANAFQRAQVIQTLCHVESCQQLQGRVQIQAAKMTGVFFVPEFSRCRISLSADHGRNVVHFPFNDKAVVGGFARTKREQCRMGQFASQDLFS